MTVTRASGGGLQPSSEVGQPWWTRCGVGDAANACGGATWRRRVVTPGISIQNSKRLHVCEPSSRNQPRHTITN